MLAPSTTRQAAVGEQGLGVSSVQLVLDGAGQGDVHLLLPGALARVELGALELLGVGGHGHAVDAEHLFHVRDLLAA